MGFSNLPPRLDQEVAVRTLQAWVSHADAAIMHISVPWGRLLDGESPESIIASEVTPVATFYRAHQLALAITFDVTDGLARDREAPDLVTRGRSIADPAIQQLYERWVTAIDTLVHPDFLGLAAETNLIRLAAPDSTYEGLVQMTRAAATAARARGSSAKLYVSVQVEAAWGRLVGTGSYRGIAEDLRDFAYIDVLGLSSYPYLGGFAAPSDVPLDYYARLREESGRPVMVVEGGWTSASVASVTSSPARQAEWIAREGALLDSARAIMLFQLEFADLDASSFPESSYPDFPFFVSLGVVDSDLNAKPALAVWDSLFALPLRP